MLYRHNSIFPRKEERIDFSFCTLGTVRQDLWVFLSLLKEAMGIPEMEIKSLLFDLEP